MTDKPRLTLHDYTVGWISALTIEQAAATAILDEEHSIPSDFPRSPNDSNLYTFGRVGSVNVVFSCLPAGQYGTNSAAIVAARLVYAFPNVRIGLMVGIGGGVPSPSNDIRLGDVVVGVPTGTNGGVVQYDLGRSLPDGHFQKTGSLNSPPKLLLSAIASIRAREVVSGHTFAGHLSALDLLPDNPFSRDRAGPDVLYSAGDFPTTRAARGSSDPVAHYGTIASGNRVIKDSVSRDRISQDLGGILCYEMEAAGLMNHFPCAVIRGVCDYADSHKNKDWQPYAAATAAAYAKQLLYTISPEDAKEDGVIDPPEDPSRDPPVEASELRSQSRISDEELFDPIVEESGTPTEGARVQGGPGRGRRRKVRGEIRDTEDEVDAKDELPSNEHVSRTLEALAAVRSQPLPTRALFTLVDRATHVHFYREVYSGNGTLYRNTVNNRGGTISTSGGAINMGSVGGSMNSTITQRARGFSTRAGDAIRAPIRALPPWGVLRYLPSWIKRR
ncbi:nucleoside phosphorylase domain-containing protein [Elsinoe ampelina]|uniref:Nucleoside phosphorylase domain-containing protein n=1 Tax=Elsinoe ampelina TaxID=302913 RepID=A0A6A6GQK7_9PEZI|nr:nucleoside phosphorylase domain-containing protein [Elsinoe ampelina]